MNIIESPTGLDVVRLAKAAGFVADHVNHDTLLYSGVEASLTKFAALVRAEVEAEWIETNKALAKEIILKNEALKLAEEALDELRYANDTDIAKTKYYKALAAIRTCLEQVSEVSLETEAEALADQFRDATKMVAEPVKQEPVAWMYECYGTTRLAKDKNTSGMHITDSIPLYAAPVDAKAIRAEAFAEAKEHFSKQLVGFRASVREQALEEAAKMAEAYVARGIGMEMATAIRGLK